MTTILSISLTVKQFLLHDLSERTLQLFKRQRGFYNLRFIGDGALGNLAGQINSLSIDMNGVFEKCSSIRWTTEVYSMIFHSVLKSCSRLTKFHFCSSDYSSNCRNVQLSWVNAGSAFLTDLKLRVTSFGECLSLLDGRFPSLTTASVFVLEISTTPSTGNMVSVNRLWKREL